MYADVPLNGVVYFDACVTHDPDTGANVDADSVPTYDVFEQSTDTPILAAQPTTKRTSKTGDYRSAITASVANGGHEVGKYYTVITTGTVTGSVSSVAITAKKISLHYRVVAAETVAGVPKGDVDYLKGSGTPVDKIVAHGKASLAVVVGSGSTTTTVKFSSVEGGAPSSVNDFYNGRSLQFTSGALNGTATSIADYDGATTTATVVALTAAPANAVTAMMD